MKKNVVILGSTGSVGSQAVEVALALSDRIRVSAIAAKGNNLALLVEQTEKLGCERVIAGDETVLADLRDALAHTAGEVAAGDAAIIDMVTAPEVDLVVSAAVGSETLTPVLKAIQAGKDVALATKEVMVMAGELIMAEAARSGAHIIPLDSEHSAIFQCLAGQNRAEVDRLILTASGGPFLDASDAEIQHATYEQALAHPKWNMGPKNSIDSASMMNKALEVIEAKYLFEIAPEKISVVIHPQAIIHSMIEFVDGVLLAQMSVPDMRFPIQYAYTWPERLPSRMAKLDFTSCPELTFRLPDHNRFPALELADAALHAGGTMPAVFNAANEVAVELFCQQRIKFPQIWTVVRKTMERHRVIAQPEIETILASSAWAAAAARDIL